jgi:hypothetical protein
MAVSGSITRPFLLCVIIKIPRIKHLGPSMLSLPQRDQLSSSQVHGLERVGPSDHHDEKWGSQQVIPQQRYVGRDIQESGAQEKSVRRKAYCVWTYTVYHRLSTLVIAANAAVVTHVCLRRRLLDDPQTCLQAVSANILIAVLIRQEHVINSLYYIVGLIPHSIPLCLRRHAANLYHLGGIHSGAAMSASAWLAVFNVAAVKSSGKRTYLDGQAVLTICLAGLLDLLLLLMLSFSLPVFRRKYHNTWEGIHRLSRWLLVLVFWFYLASYIYLLSRIQTDHWSLAKLFYANPVFYLLITMTFFVAFPWMRLRKVVPRYQRLSDHAIQLHFDHWYVSPCKTPKFSTLPITEWHAFAGVPYPNGTGHSVIISRAGDWTSKMIDDPPPHLYTKGYPVQGVLYMAKIFKTVLCVGTGSGIAPILGLLDIPGTQFKVLWSVRDPENTYSEEIVQRLRKSDGNAVILDTLRDGRSDLVERAARIYHTGGIEGVFVISNAKVTREVVRGLQQMGIPAYGPIFDS